MLARKLQCQDLGEVIAECRRLLENGYSSTGKWSLGQICQHIRMTIDSNIDGYPTWMSIAGYPLRPVLRRFVLPKLLGGQSPAGIPTASKYVPSANLDDAAEVEEFERCVHRFESHQGNFFPHPGFGQLGREGFKKFHAAHAAHHLSFLIPDNGPNAPT